MDESLIYDASLAAAIMLVELFQASPGATTMELLGQAVVIIGEAIKAAAVFDESDGAFSDPDIQPSVN